MVDVVVFDLALRLLRLLFGAKRCRNRERGQVQTGGQQRDV
jgi:hypothetical protein